MNVAISGDRSTCLTDELAPGTFLFALARGFGEVKGAPVAQFALSRLRTDIARRTRGRRLERALRRPKGIAAMLTASLKHVSADVYGCTASNDDFVTAGCSVTTALLIDNALHLAHAGATAAYLLRDGNIVRLTKSDAIQTPAGLLVTRALGIADDLRVSVGTIALTDGDTLVFQWESEPALTVKFAASPVLPPMYKGNGMRRAALGIAATVFFYAMCCLS